MPRIQITHLLIAAAVLMCGCSPDQSAEKPRTVAQYMHDMDAAYAALKHYSNDPGRYQDSADWANASAATQKIQFHNECWPQTSGEKKRFTTANTDHACLDERGFRR